MRYYKLLLLAVVFITGNASAAIYERTYTNSSAIDGIYFKVNGAGASFQGFDFLTTEMEHWTSVVLSSNEVYLTGPRLAPRTGRFEVSIDSPQQQFDIEYATYIWNNNTVDVATSGTLRYRGNTYLGRNATFDEQASLALVQPAVVPLPPSFYLLSSSLAGMAVMVRRNRVS